MVLTHAVEGNRAARVSFVGPLPESGLLLGAPAGPHPLTLSRDGCYWAPVRPSALCTVRRSSCANKHVSMPGSMQEADSGLEEGAMTGMQSRCFLEAHVCTLSLLQWSQTPSLGLGYIRLSIPAALRL